MAPNQNHNWWEAKEAGEKRRTSAISSMEPEAASQKGDRGKTQKAKPLQK